MKSRFTIKKEEFFCLLTLWVWIQPILLQYIRAVIMRLPFIGDYADILLTCIFVVLILFSLPYLRIGKADLIFLVSTVLVFLLECFFYTDNQQYLDQYMVDFVICTLPIYVVGVSLGYTKNKEKIIYLMYLLSYATLTSAILYRFIFGSPMSAAVSQYKGDMDHAYKVLPYCCLIAHYSIKEKNVWNVAFAILGGFYLLMLGTRGAALLYLVLVVLLLIMGTKSKGMIIRIGAVFSALGAFVVSPLYNASLLWMSRLAQQLGLSIRIFDKLMSGAGMASSGRDVIAQTLLSAVAEKPLWGYGIGGDRMLAGTYAHNIVLELWVDFGVIIGTILFVILLIIIFQGYIKAMGEKEKGLILILFFSSFCMLFLSGSYLDNRLLFFLLGLCATSIRKCKHERVR